MLPYDVGGEYSAVPTMEHGDAPWTRCNDEHQAMQRIFNVKPLAAAVCSYEDIRSILWLVTSESHWRALTLHHRIFTWARILDYPTAPWRFDVMHLRPDFETSWLCQFPRAAWSVNKVFPQAWGVVKSNISLRWEWRTLCRVGSFPWHDLSFIEAMPDEVFPILSAAHCPVYCVSLDQRSRAAMQKAIMRAVIATHQRPWDYRVLFRYLNDSPDMWRFIAAFPEKDWNKFIELDRAPSIPLNLLRTLAPSLDWYALASHPIITEEVVKRHFSLPWQCGWRDVQRSHAASIIQRWFLPIYYDPGTALCKRRLMREFESLSTETETPR